MRARAETTAWARRYRTALGRFLRQAPSMRQASAEQLGGQAASLGLEPLSIAGIHEHALQRVAPPEDAPGHARQEMIAQAEIFFKQTIEPIEATHPAARKTEARIDQLHRALQRRTGALSDASDRLKQATTRRQTAEAQTANRERQNDQRLMEAKRMQSRLRDCMRGILMHQEGERKRIGDELRDEIAQALLAIDFCLLALHRTEQVHAGKLDKSIAEAQRLLHNVTQ